MALSLLERIHAGQSQVQPLEEQALLALLCHLDEPGA
jgi:hypothetical protein